MDRFYFIDKPLNISSFDIIRVLRKKLNIRKMWHTGTLDPLATGGMLIATWNYTKLIPYLEKESKTYEFTIRLDGTTSSLDLAEEITYISEKEQKEAQKNISLEKVQKVIKNNFVWKISQIPPKYSAIRINGKRAYELARKWEEVKMKSREIEIFEHEILGYNYPDLKLRARVSAGTYIRTIAWDLWKILSTGWYITKLRRTKIWNLDIEDAIDLDLLEEKNSTDIKNILDTKYFLENFDAEHIRRLDDWLERIGEFNLEQNKAYFIYNWEKVTNIVQYNGESLVPLKKIC